MTFCRRFDIVAMANGSFFYQALLAQMHTWEVMMLFPSHTLIYWLLAIPPPGLTLRGVGRCNHCVAGLGTESWARLHPLWGSIHLMIGDAPDSLPLQSGVTPSKAIQLYRFIVVGFRSVASNWLCSEFPQFPCSICFNRKGKEGLGYGAEASGVPPFSPSAGFLFCLFVFSWVAEEKVNGAFKLCLSQKLILSWWQGWH